MCVIYMITTTLMVGGYFFYFFQEKTKKKDSPFNCRLSIFSRARASLFIFHFILFFLVFFFEGES